MAGFNEDWPEKSLRNDCEADSSALQSAKSYLAGSAGPSEPGDGSCKAFATSFGALVEWGEKRSLIQVESDFPFFIRPPDAQGNEHEVWFDESSNRWFKATYPNEFGLAWGREGTATPYEYLTRLLLQNEFFHDDIQLVALIRSNQKLRVLISQPHIAGDPACAAEIQEWFIGLEFVRLEHDQCIAWYRRNENLMVADAHEGNVIRTAAGELVPIDLNITQPRGEIFAWAVAQWEQACGS